MIERIAEMVSEGYLSGENPSWEIKYGHYDGLDKDGMYYISYLIRRGDLFGSNPVPWELSIYETSKV